MPYTFDSASTAGTQRCQVIDRRCCSMSDPQSIRIHSGFRVFRIWIFGTSFQEIVQKWTNTEPSVHYRNVTIGISSHWEVVVGQFADRLAMEAMQWWEGILGVDALSLCPAARTTTVRMRLIEMIECWMTIVSPATHVLSTSKGMDSFPRFFKICTSGNLHQE